MTENKVQFCNPKNCNYTVTIPTKNGGTVSVSSNTQAMAIAGMANLQAMAEVCQCGNCGQSNSLFLVSKEIQSKTGPFMGFTMICKSCNSSIGLNLNRDGESFRLNQDPERRKWFTPQQQQEGNTFAQSTSQPQQPQQARQNVFGQQQSQQPVAQQQNYQAQQATQQNFQNNTSNTFGNQAQQSQQRGNNLQGPAPEGYWSDDENEVPF